ncbi:MAG: ATP-binding protein [Pseudomonadota bacterium]
MDGPSPTVTLHIPTIFLMIMVASAAMAVALAAIGYQGHRSLWAWSMAMMLQVVTYGLFALRGRIPDVLSVVVANMAVAATLALLSIGLYRFQQRKVPPWVFPLPVAVIGIGFLIVLDHFKVRLLLGAGVFLAQLIHLLIVLVQGRHETPGRGKFIFGFPIALFALSLLARMIGAILGIDTPASLADPTAITMATFVSALLTTVLATVGGLMMVQERGERALSASESRYRKLIDGASEGICVIEGGVFRFINPEGLRLIGYSAKELIGAPFLNVIHPDDHAMVILNYQKRLQGQSDNFKYPLRVLTADRGVRWLEVGGVAFQWQGKPATLNFLTDITERKRDEASLQEAHDELKRHRDHLDERVQERTRELALARDLAQAADRAKTALLANVSHELRTPLNHIVGNGYLLAEGLKDPEKKAQADTIVAASRQLLALVNDLIEMARLESQQIQLDAIDFSLRSVLDRAQHQHHRAMQAKGLKLVLEVDARLPDAWVGDPIRLGQVLHHFLDNATKYSDSGQVTLRCQPVGDLANGGALRFEVEDQGVGIGPEQRRKLFTLFEQGDGSSTRRQGGTGIGLAFAKRVVGLMGGEIGVESVLGQGSRFWFTVTFKPAKAVVAAALPRQRDPHQAHDAAARMARLLADDDASALELWQAYTPLFVDLLGQRAEAFGQAVERFEFSQALELLRQHDAG